MTSKTNDIVVTLPSSKSLSNRWLVLNYLSGGAFRITNLSSSSDTRLLRLLLAQLGRRSTAAFHCGNAGSVARFLLPLLAITPGTHRLTGDERLLQRPMGDLIAALRGMGFVIHCLGNEGFLPVEVVGGVPSRKMAFVDPTLSSQFVSALMLAAPVFPNGMTISMTRRPSSRPYLAMTCDVLRRAGVEVSLSANGRVYSVHRKDDWPVSTTTTKAVAVEADWSAASYFFTAAALERDRRIRLKGLSLNTVQGDAMVAEVFSHLGVAVCEVKAPFRSASRTLMLTGSQQHDSKVVFNFLDCPDLFPTVAVACAALGVDARFKGLGNLRLKESDRVAAVSAELQKMGVSLTLGDDEMHLLPSTLCPSSPVSTYGDHRIAMAFAPLRLLFPNLEINNPEVVVKSFPDFWHQFALLLK